MELKPPAETKAAKNFRSGCIVCGNPLVYFDSAKSLSCEICGKPFETNASCDQGHYVCDKCHAQKAFDFITDYALQSHGKNPAAMATEMMKNPYVNMHGPEHHYLIAAALLAAYKNSGGKIDFKACLDKIRERAKNVPGGICGLWGSCGAGIASGIFISVITGATSLSEKEWGLSNAMTSASLNLISQNGGPRCCKRNTYLAIKTAVGFVRGHFGIEMENDANTVCGFFHMNKHCKKTACLFWPKKTGGN